MYNRYIRNEQGAYSRIPQQEPAPGPVSGRPPPPPPSEPPPPGGDSSPAVLRREGRRPSRRSRPHVRQRDGFWTGCCPGSIWGTSTPGICCFC